MVHIGNSWDELLKDEWDKDYYKQLRSFLAAEYKTRTIYPDMHDIFNALKHTDYGAVKVVILGQDPYHGKGQAHGLSFSVQKGVQTPPSLQNMYKELHSDLGFTIPKHGCLTQWADKGVLLLNTVLTVQEATPNSHKGKGWEIFTDKVISLLDARQEPIVFLLWGNNAKGKKALIHNPNHLVLTAAHPSPLSAHNGFFGCKHFSQANAFLGQRAVDWSLTDEQI